MEGGGEEGQGARDVEDEVVLDVPVLLNTPVAPYSMNVRFPLKLPTQPFPPAAKGRIRPRFGELQLDFMANSSGLTAPGAEQFEDDPDQVITHHSIPSQPHHTFAAATLFNGAPSFSVACL